MKHFLFVLFLVVSFFSYSQKNKETTKHPEKPFTLKLKTNGFKQYCFLAFHQGKNKYRLDSIAFNPKGEATFIDKENKVKGGIYLLVFPTLDNNYFEFLVSLKERNMELEIDTSMLHKTKIKNSEENDYFFGEIEYMQPYYVEIQKLNEQRKNADLSENEKTKIDDRLREIENLMNAKRDEVINKKPDLLYSKVMKMLKEVGVPDPPKDANGKILDSNFQYQYYKTHYWDNIDLNDDRLLYTPVFEGKFETFFDRLIPKHPDSIAFEIDRTLAKINDKNSMMFKYMLSSLLSKYANSKVMGQDALYVHIVQNYYNKGKAPWVDSTTLSKMKYDAEDLAPVLIGKIAPDFTVFDTTLAKTKSLYSIQSKYKIIAFYSHDCGHCKKEIPKLDSIYPELQKLGVDVFYVCTVVDKDNEIEKWKSFYREHKFKTMHYADPKHQLYPFFKVLYKIKGTPEYYILDSKNKIIAKKLAPEQMLDFISNYEKYNKN